MNPELEIAKDIASYTRDPLGYSIYAFPWHSMGELAESSGPRKWQKDILRDIGEHLRGPNWATPLQIAIASGHGIGKTALIAMVCKWAVDTCEDCRVVVTANTEPQLATKTWPEISKWFGLAVTARWFQVGATTIATRERGKERTWRVDRIAWSENNTEAFAGLHNRGKRIVVVYDEASAISDKIWEVTEGALTDEGTEIIWLAFGNPTKNTGRFRECFGRYKHRWKTKHIDSRGIEGTNKEQLDKWVEDYGEDSDFVRVRVRGEFPRAGSQQFIGGDIVSAARHRMLLLEQYSHHWKVLVCDVARFGDDQTIIGYRQGPKFVVTDRMRGKSVVETARQLMYRMKEHDPRTTVIDGDGVGGGVVDIVREEMRYWLEANKARRLTEFHGGSAPRDGFMYFNYRAEMWGRMRDWLASGSIPDDPEMEADLTGPEYFFSNKNQIQLEKKEDMKKRGLASPDLGDTLAMSFCAIVASKTIEERDREKLLAAADPMERALIQFRLTNERDARERLAEERRPDWWA